MAKKITTRSSGQRLLLTEEYIERDVFQNGKLPSKKSIVEMMMFMTHPYRVASSHRTLHAAAELVADAVSEIWKFCNIVTKNVRFIVADVEKLYTSFRNLHRERNRPNPTWTSRAVSFNASIHELFDVFCEDPVRRKKQELLTGVKMTAEDYDFLENMRSVRTGYCASSVDRQWAATMARKEQIERGQARMRLKSIAAFRSTCGFCTYVQNTQISAANLTHAQIIHRLRQI